ncbi:ABC transporter permease [Clostridium sp. C2-6-12]|uniref:ABC transporter permease n=1 Tax=Clostridium sp. C2-6-12 TaxID=2698832 RepID=UPI00136DEB6B|nr:ABC transporter permease [Clostridium sp. C2-6-12]
MLNSIYCEFLKLKKSYIWIVILVSGLAVTSFLDLIILILKDKRTFESYASNTEMANFLLLYTILFSLIVGYVFSREHEEKTSNILFSYPIPRIKIFMAKFITIDILIFCVYLIELISIYLGYYFLYKKLPESTFIVNHIIQNIYSLIFQYLLIPIPILITNISRNIMAPVVYGVIVEILMGTIANEYFPFFAPYYFALETFKPKLTNVTYSAVGSVICFIIFMSISIYHYNKTDII